MVSKADIVSAFNSVFSSNKVYAELDEYEKLYSLLILLINNGTGSNGDNELVELIRLRDKTVEANQLAIDSNGQIGINNLTALAVALNDILSELNNKADVTQTQPVSLTTIPLATNAASETTLGNINTKLPSTLGSKTAANSLAVTLSSDGIFATAFGTASDTSATTDTANTGFISLVKRLLEKITTGINTTVTNLVPTVGISGSKNITTASTFEVLTTSNTLASGIYVQAKTTNTGLVTVRYLGTTDGVVLEKGQSLFFAINNSNKLEVAVSTNGEGIRWWGS